MSVKVVVCSLEGSNFFHLLDDVPGTEVTVVEQSEVLQAVADAEVYYGFPSPEIVTAAKALKWVQSPSAGVEYVARVPELVTRDILLTNSRGAHGPSIGEHTIALLLAMTRHIPESIDQYKRKFWDRGPMYKSAREIGGMTMGILGYGFLGRGIAQRAVGMGLNVLAVDMFPGDTGGFCDEVWNVDRLDEMIERSDCLVVAVPLTPETRHMINLDRLNRMKSDAYLVVVSRGGIVDENALVEVLNRGHLAGAGLDVVETEPLPENSPIWDAPRLLLTPHLAGASQPKERRVVEIFRENLQRYVRNEDLINLVDKTRGF